MTLNPPDCLRQISPFLKRAEEAETSLARISPGFAKFAYYCRFAAAEQGMELLGALGGADKAAAEGFLGSLLEKLESDRAAFGIEAAEKEVDIANLTTYALTVFKRADDIDRGGAADKNTARAFIAAANFMDVARQLGPKEEQLDRMSKHAKGRAAEILRAVKEGRPVTLPEGATPGGDPLAGMGFDFPTVGDAPVNVTGGAGMGGGGHPSASAPSPYASASSTFGAGPSPSTNPYAPMPAAHTAPYGDASGPTAASPSPYAYSPMAQPPSGTPSGYGSSLVSGLVSGVTSLATNAASALSAASSAASTGAAATPSPGGRSAVGGSGASSSSSTPVPRTSSSASHGSAPSGVRAASRLGLRGVPAAAMGDAIEYTKHALAALREDDPDHAAALLRQALSTIGR